ncbi:MAG TPA: hypothetical protein VF785_01035 [Gemmatimonadaceae bacterium]
METANADTGLDDDAISAERPAAESAKQTAKERALSKFMEIGTVKGACAAAGVPRRTWYNWMESDESFAALVVDASEHVSDELEGEAIARAKNGSDTLLMFLLKARRPAVYREKHTITVVSPEVVTRLTRQADTIMHVCRTELEPHVAASLIRKLAEALDAVWS